MEEKFVKNLIADLVKVLNLTSYQHTQNILQLSEIFVSVLRNNRKILFAGNGGSAAEATHIAAEFTGRFKLERVGWPAISLSADQSAITSIANDFGYENVFSRQIEALGQEGDVFVALSTSGNSENLIKAITIAKKKSLQTVSLLGKTGGEMKGKSSMEIIVPSDDTARIQEVHLLILHSACELTERKLINHS